MNSPIEPGFGWFAIPTTGVPPKRWYAWLSCGHTRWWNLESDPAGKSLVCLNCAPFATRLGLIFGRGNAGIDPGVVHQVCTRARPQW